MDAFDTFYSNGQWAKLVSRRSSILSDRYKTELLKSVINRDKEALGKPVGKALVEYGAGAFGGAVLSKAFSWVVGRIATGIAASGIKPTVNAINGIEIRGFTQHGIHRAIERGVKPDQIMDALKNPLKVGTKIQDQAGRYSQRFIGKSCEVVTNPQTGKIISVNPTSSKKAIKLMNMK
jgi:hypothetical protein